MEWNVTSEVRGMLPNSPDKFATVVNSIIEQATPLKTVALQKLGKQPLKVKKRNRRQNVDVDSIQKFYIREDISMVLPQKRYATKEGPDYTMQLSVPTVHLLYNTENPTKQVS